MQVKVKKLVPEAFIPTYGTLDAACFDIYSIDEGYVIGEGSQVFSTGLSFEIPRGYAMMVYSRSGHGFKNDVRLSNCVGIIDADYRGELKIKLAADHIYKGMMVKAGDRIAQGMIIPVPAVSLIEVDELSTTERGIGGFGSTGN